MRLRAVSRTLGYLLLIFSGAFLLPVLAGASFGEDFHSLFYWYGLPAILSVSTAAGLLALARQEEDLRDRDSFIAVAAAWLLISLFGSLPFILSGALPGFVDAFFESTSGFTTTGATVIANVEGLPHSLLLWRASTALIGGMGIIVLSMVVLSRVVGGSTQLFRAEASVHTSIRMRPTIRQIATTLWAIYLGLILIETALLSAAGMDLFDSVCHSFTTLSTCGFSTRNAGIAAYNPSPWIGTIVTLFMLLGGMSFILHYEWLTGKFRKLRENPELWGYLLLLGVASTIVFIVIAVQDNNYRTYREIAGHGIFQAVSIMTTTGLSTTDYALWPSGPQLLLIFLMLVGGCSASTAGGIKVIRFIVLLKMVRNEVYRVIHPRAVLPVTLGGRPIPNEVTKNVVSFFFIYIVIFFIVALGLCIVGMTIPEGLASSAAGMGNIGPALGRVGPMATYADIHVVGKALMCFAMWVGRLEIYPALLLLSPGAYKR